MAVIVTHKELRIKGQKPNWPSIGDHSDEVIKFIIEWFLKSPDDFTINPVAIASGKSRKKLNDAIIHLDDKESIILRLVMFYKL